MSDYADEIAARIMTSGAADVSVQDAIAQAAREGYMLGYGAGTSPARHLTN